MLGVVYYLGGRYPVPILGVGRGGMLGVTAFGLGGNAVEEFDLVHCRFGVVFGRFLDLESVEEKTGVEGFGGCFFYIAVLDHPDSREVAPAEFFNDYISVWGGGCGCGCGVSGGVWRG